MRFGESIGKGIPRLALLVAFSCVFVGAVSVTPVRAAEPLKPTITLPQVNAVSADQYFILLLKWARTVVMKPVTTSVVYRDPLLVLAQLKQSDPNIGSAAFAKAMAGFPKVLRFSVAFRAASRKFLQPKKWRVDLVGPGGKRIAASASRKVSAPTLKDNAAGAYWEEDWNYQFHVPPEFLGPHTRDFGIALSGPSGAGSVAWHFGAVAVVASNPDAYVPYLGIALLAFSGLVIAGLLLTRRPRRSLS